MDKNKTYPINIQDLEWSFGTNKVLKNIDLTVEKGKFYTIIGPNGCGKSTLLKNISRSLEPKKNSIYIDNFDITELKNKEVAKKISSVPQNTNIDFEFSVMDIVMMGRTPYLNRFQSESKKDIEIVNNAMKATNIWNLKDKNIKEISGGERQRVIIARALAQNTNIMLLDEPVSQLDIQHQVELMETISGLIKKSNITVISVLHDLNLAAGYSDYIFLIKEGKIVAEGTAEEVITKENIGLVYNIDVHVMKSPVTGRPHIIPIKIRNNVN